MYGFVDVVPQCSTDPTSFSFDLGHPLQVVKKENGPRLPSKDDSWKSIGFYRLLGEALFCVGIHWRRSGEQITSDHFHGAFETGFALHRLLCT